jgi:hypothetical protein
MSVQPPTDGHSHGGSDDDASLPDDIWERFLSDNESDIRATAPKEPSARARQVARRLRQQEALAAAAIARRRRTRYNPWFRLRAARARGRLAGGRSAPRYAAPAGWRDGSARRRIRVRARGGRAVRGPWRTLLVLIVLVGVLLLVLDPSAALSWFGRGHRDGGAPAPTRSASAARVSDVPTQARPFAGSPAAAWADGAAGVVPPPAKAVGSASRSQVRDALRTTQRYVVAANLDPRTLRGDWPAAAIALIDPRDTATLARFDRDLRTPDAQHDPLGLLTRYNPADLRLVGSVIKVKGTMSFRAGPSGSVDVNTDYTFVYPFTKADGATGQISRVIVRQTLRTRVDPASPGHLHLLDVRTHDFDNSCAAHDGYLHPAFAGDAPTPSATPAPTAPRVDPYDLATPAAALPTACSRLTRD